MIDMSKIRFDVSFYNDQEMAKLLAQSPPKELTQLVETGLTVDSAEFWTYALFAEQRQNPHGARTFTDIRTKLGSYIQAFEDQFDTSGGSLIARHQLVNNSWIEFAGIGGALSCVSAIHQMTEADWQRIGQTSSYKTLDFVASDGKRTVQVEAKGTQIEDPSHKGQQSGKTDHIHKKKDAARGPAPTAVVGAPSATDPIYYGCITAFSSTPERTAHIKLVDPPSTIELEDPRRHRILARLTFYRNLLLAVYSRSPVVTALSNRLRIVESIQEWATLDGIGLTGADGEDLAPLADPPASKITTSSGDAFGEVLLLGKEALLFVGVKLSILRVVCKQSFDGLIAFKEASKVTPSYLRGTIAKRQVPTSWVGKLKPEKSTGRFRATMEGKLIQPSSGRVIGLVRITGTY